MNNDVATESTGHLRQGRQRRRAAKQYVVIMYQGFAASFNKPTSQRRRSGPIHRSVAATWDARVDVMSHCCSDPFTVCLPACITDVLDNVVGSTLCVDASTWPGPGGESSCRAHGSEYLRKSSKRPLPRGT